MNATHNTHNTRIELLRPHEHGGRKYPAGSTIAVRADQADWLVALGKARTVSGEPAKSAAGSNTSASKTRTAKE